jgi:glycosyltransferase involved in cell wall biosynthesis
MIDVFNRVRVSVVLLHRSASPYGAEAFTAGVRSALTQDHPGVDVVVVDDRGASATADYLPADLRGAANFTHVAGTYATRAAMYNAGLAAAKGDYILLLANDDAAITLRTSAVRTLVMAAARHPQAGMIYADYESVDADGTRRDRHLLDWHPGRLRDTTDFGKAWLLPAAWLRKAKLSEKYAAADLYDLRLRASEQGPLVHVANRYAGSLYTVAAPPAAHNVFAYLLADRKGQLELEDAETEHLKRTAAYLAPGEHYGTPAYSSEENARFKECIASVIIPVNNRPEFIARAIESVQRQTVRQVEIMVMVNGGPADPTIPAVRRFMEGGDRYDAKAPRVAMHIVDINNLGLCFNTGLSAARGKYYVQLDSDDRLKPDAVEKIVAVFESDPKIGMVVGSYEVWNLDVKSGEVTRNEQIPVVTHEEWTEDNGRNNLLRINGAGAPRAAHIKVIAECGWFGVNDDEQCRNYGEDYDLVLRISERYRIGRVWDPIYEVIRHPGGTDHSIDQSTIDRNDNAKDAMRLHALARRRRINQGQPWRMGH